MEWFSASDFLPEPQNINDGGGKYYLVKIGNYTPITAMYLIDDNGDVGWYESYVSKIIYDVDMWLDYDDRS